MPPARASKAVDVSQTINWLPSGLVRWGATLLGYATVSRSLSLQHSSALERENAELAEQIGQLSGRVNGLTDTLRLIARRDARIRLMANLEPNDPQVQKAGIGGPAPSGGTPRPSSVLAGEREFRWIYPPDSAANLLAFSTRKPRHLASHRDRMAAMPSILRRRAGSRRLQSSGSTRCSLRAAPRGHRFHARWDLDSAPCADWL